MMPDVKPIRWRIYFGAMTSSIEEQLSEQNLAIPHVERYQKMADAITLLSVRGLLSQAERKRARQRLVKLIGGKVLRVE
jgi:glycyl-tRNA synthetase alpha subunit